MAENHKMILTKPCPIDLIDESDNDIIEGILEKSDQLNEECKKTLARILEDFKDLWKVKYLTKTSICKHEICLDTDRPICCRPRPYTPDQARTIKEEVKKMLDEGIIRPSKSPFASCVVLVKKKTGEWRFCIDYRPLNKATIKDSHPLPRIKDLLMSIEGARYFVSLDLRSGYWQVEVADEDIHKTAFRTPDGLYEFTRMPFGLVNAPATFQRLMETVFGDLRWKGVLIYLDDVLILGKTAEEALNKLKEVFQRLKEANLSLRLDKCEFFPRKINYLGFDIEEGKLVPMEKKIQALKDFEEP